MPKNESIMVTVKKNMYSLSQLTAISTQFVSFRAFKERKEKKSQRTVKPCRSTEHLVTIKTWFQFADEKQNPIFIFKIVTLT